MTLAIGSRIKHRATGLTGRIRDYEWTVVGTLSPIPYNVEWDDNEQAYKRIGCFYMYASDDTIEPAEG